MRLPRPHALLAFGVLIGSPAFAASIGQVIAIAHNKGTNTGSAVDIDWTNADAASVTNHSNPTYALAWNQSAEAWFAVQRAGAGVQRLVRLDPETKEVSSTVGALVDSGDGYNHKVTAMGFSGNTLYGVSARWEDVGGFWAPMGKLVTINTSTGSVTEVGDLGHTVYSRGGKVSDGVFKLVTVTDNSTRSFELYDVNLSTGASSLVGSTGQTGRAVGVSTDPDGDMLVVLNGVSNTTSSLYTLNGSTGGTSLVGSTGTSNLSAMAYGTPDIPCGFIMGGTLDVSADAIIDSWDSTQGSYNPSTVDDTAILCADGDVDVRQNATVYGSVYYNAGLDIASSATVTGDTRPWVSDFVMPTVDVSTVSTNNDNDNIPLTSDGKSPFKGNSLDIDLKNSSVLTLPAGTYYVTSITMRGSPQISTTGIVTLYVDGDIDIKEDALLNDGGDPVNLDILVTGTDVGIKANGEAAAQITAPNATIDLKGSGDFYGTLLADDVQLKEDVKAHIDSSLQ